MAKIAVAIPTVPERTEYLARAIDGYSNRHETEHIVVPTVVSGLWSGGMAWQKLAESAADIEADYLHLTNDDIVPGYGWLQPMIDSVERGEVPVGLIVTGSELVIDQESFMPLPGNPVSEHTSHFEGIEQIQPAGTVGRTESEYPSLPFCSMQQWERIGPMIPTQYGTDKWFGYRARLAGYPSVCVDATFYHYAAGIGRDNMVDGWLGHDRLNFDLNIAYPLYKSGALALDQLHPQAKTLQGREESRDWHEKHIGWRPGTR